MKNIPPQPLNIIKIPPYVRNTEELGINLRKARENAELTQSSAGSAIGLSHSCIGYYELGRTTPTIFTLVKLSKIYNISLLDLIIM